MDADELQIRTRQFALRVIQLVDALPQTIAGREIGRQLLRSATGVSANCRAARRARSRKEFIAKIGVVVEEADESEHWLDLVGQAGLITPGRLGPLHDESIALMKVFARTRGTARKSPDRPIAKSPDATDTRSK